MTWTDLWRTWKKREDKRQPPTDTTNSTTFWAWEITFGFESCVCVCFLLTATPSSETVTSSFLFFNIYNLSSRAHCCSSCSVEQTWQQQQTHHLWYKTMLDVWPCLDDDLIRKQQVNLLLLLFLNDNINLNRMDFYDAIFFPIKSSRP